MNMKQTMPEPPEVITTKDLSYLKDALSWQILAIKKCHHFAQECMDQNLQQKINEAGEMHQRHYELLLKHVDPNSSINNMQ